MHSRRYLDRMGRKKCDTELVGKEMCVADVPTCDNHAVEIVSTSVYARACMCVYMYVNV